MIHPRSRINDRAVSMRVLICGGGVIGRFLGARLLRRHPARARRAISNGPTSPPATAFGACSLHASRPISPSRPQAGRAGAGSSNAWNPSTRKSLDSKMLRTMSIGMPDTPTLPARCLGRASLAPLLR
jgi:hypothetical protein